MIGLTHGAAVGLVALPMMPAIHPRMSAAVVATGHAGEVRLSAPGVFGSRWGAMTPVGLLAGQAVYGAVVALVYGLFV